GVHPFGRAAHLASRTPYRFGCLELEAGDPLGRLAAFDFGASETGLLVTSAKRVTHRDADAPGRIIGRERLTERVAETSATRAGHDARKSTGAEQLQAAEPVAA